MTAISAETSTTKKQAGGGTGTSTIGATCVMPERIDDPLLHGDRRRGRGGRGQGQGQGQGQGPGPRDPDLGPGIVRTAGPESATRGTTCVSPNCTWTSRLGRDTAMKSILPHPLEEYPVLSDSLLFVAAVSFQRERPRENIEPNRTLVLRGLSYATTEDGLNSLCSNEDFVTGLSRFVDCLGLYQMSVKRWLSSPSRPASGLPRTATLGSPGDSRLWTWIRCRLRRR